jgi:hypothetical protein
LSGSARDAWLAIVAAALIWRATTHDRTTLTGHAVVFSIAAAFSSGLLAFTARAWLGPAAQPDTLRPLALAVLAVSALGLLVGRRQTERRVPTVESLARLAHVLVLVSGVGALAVAMTTRWIGGLQPDAAVLATIRSVTLAAGAVGLAAAARVSSGRELGWLAYPVLAVAGVKLIAEDLHVSSPAMLFLVLAVYGLSLILTAKLFGRRRPRPMVPARGSDGRALG